MLVAVFMIIVVKHTCARRGTKPVVAKPATCLMPPLLNSLRNVSITETFAPALDACWICETITSMGRVQSVLPTPPRSDAVIFSPFVSTLVESPRLKKTSSACTEKKKRVDQSATRFIEKTVAPFINAAGPSMRITFMPTCSDFFVVSIGVIFCRKTGSVITRVLSSSVGLSTRPWKPPPIPPAITSAAFCESVPFSTSGCTFFLVSAWAQANTAPLATAWIAPHGKKPSQMPTMPLACTISRVSVAYDSVGRVCFMILVNSKQWPNMNSKTSVTPAPMTSLTPGRSAFSTT